MPTAFGIYIDRFTFPFVGIHELPVWVGVAVTIVWVVALMNMVNFLDGMDGLAAGVCGIAGFTFAVIALSLGKPTAAVFSAIVAGACFGFLRHNFYPARIFMGDSGALLLGFALATISIQGLLKTAATVALFFPLFVLAIPIVDTGFVLARRLRHGEKLYAADQAHLHFRFLRRGFTQRRATLTMYGWCLALAAAALATRFVPFREGGEWHLWPSLLAGAIGLVARRVLDLRRLRARARQAREPASPPPRGLTSYGQYRNAGVTVTHTAPAPVAIELEWNRSRSDSGATRIGGDDLPGLRVEAQDHALVGVVPPERARRRSASTRTGWAPTGSFRSRGACRGRR